MTTQKRYISLILVIICTINLGYSQCTIGPNLVPNPSFEQQSVCPNGFAQEEDAERFLNFTEPWFTPTLGTADVFSDCCSCPFSTPDITVPQWNNSLFASQVPRTGSSYAGVITNDEDFVTIGDYAEYLGVPLLEKLKMGRTYELTFYVSLADRMNYMTVIGASFSDIKIDIPESHAFIDLNPYVQSAPISDKDNWVEVSGTFTALGTEQYLYIGLFDSMDKTLTQLQPNNTREYAHYLVDDVSVREVEGSDTVDAGPDVNITLGSSTTLNATPSNGNPTYSWSANPTDVSLTGQETVQNPTVSPVVTTTYTVTADFGGGCTNTDTVTVFVGGCTLSLNDANISINNALCGQTNGSITGIAISGNSGNETYSWVDNDGDVVSTTLDFYDIRPGINYMLTVIDEGCTEQLGPFEIEENDPPTVNFDNVVINNETCTQADGSITGIVVSDASGSETYRWTRLNDFIANGIDLINVPAGEFYTLTIIDGICEVVGGTYTIGRDTNIIIDDSNVNITHPFCGQTNGNITGITVSGVSSAATYSWTNIYGIEVGSTIDLLNVGFGEYTLTVNDNGCEDQVGPFSLVETGSGAVINDVDIIIEDADCTQANGSITGIVILGATLGGETYSWTDSSGTEVSTMLDLVNVGPGDYVITVLYNGCSRFRGPYTVNQNTSFLIDSSNMTITDTDCGQTNGSITGIAISGNSGSETYSWTDSSNTEVGTTIDLYNVGDDSYTLTVIDNGCTDTVVATVGDCNPCPETINAGIDITINSGDTTTLNATPTGGSATYIWSATPADNSLSGQENLQNPTVSPTVTTTYTVTADFGSGCMDTDTVTVFVGACTLMLDDSGITYTDATCNQTDGGISGIIINGGSGSETYSWTDSNATEVGTMLSLLNVGLGSYTLTVTDSANCSVNGTYNVNESGPPDLEDDSVQLADADCGQANGSITGIVYIGDTNGAVFEWTDAGGMVVGNTVDLNNIGLGSYILNVTDAAGCGAIVGPYAIGELGAPIVDLGALSINDRNCETDNGSITGITILNPTGNETFRWADADNAMVGDSPDLLNVGAGIYTLTVTENGCSALAGPFVINDSCNPVGDIRIANTMTPNGDGANDTFMIEGLENYLGHRLYIYNRWGNKLYETDNYDNGWNGTFKGRPLPVATYYYILELNDTDKNIMKGYITILR